MVIIKEVNVDDDIIDQYKETKWGKSEEGEYIVDGYTFKGKRSLNGVLKGLKKILKKGVENEIGKTKFKALDVRQNGTALEVAVEAIDDDRRGIAIVKLYGPSKKKKMNVIMVSK